ncbi:DUF2270 domain-containing protein [Natrinema halophilum]|uniref:DUF2270 domain-containing protein n=1 Tax=Natrinema halophilum TaxID=1699371 RepID=A0A7D5KRF6_9EURY|nr:DUF2270 domain-containing protein [Natrinema halophilum]QLG49297.1 DUF2270 domain-containing protein [Natrinema halophilum]
MSDSSSNEVDATDQEHREVGRGLLDEEMGPSGAMAHLYRGEIHRMRFWRERLDRTTNWAVIILAALLTWAFSSESNPHYVLLAGSTVLCVFMTIEARRYRGYDIWRSRMRTLQKNVFAYGLDPSQGLEDQDWRAKLSKDYREPRLKISRTEAIAHRLRRVYLPLVTIILGAWVLRITAFADVSWPASAMIGVIPGTVVTATVFLSYIALFAIALNRKTWHAETELMTEDLRNK